MIQLKHLPDEGILVCTLDGNWTQEAYRQMLRRMDVMAAIQPLDVIVDLRTSRLLPPNLMELMREGIDLARRTGVHVVMVSETSLFARAYQVVNTAYYGGQETCVSFAESPEQARHLLHRKQTERESVSSL
jgi:hypothetical protein